MCYYFAYGSNMSTVRMKNERGIDFTLCTSAILNDYKLIFNVIPKNEVYANIKPEIGNKVEGILYEFDDVFLNKNLDSYEGYPNIYDRIEVDVFVPKFNKNIKSWVYISNNNNIDVNLPTTKNYMNLLLQGKDFISTGYYNKLLTNYKTIDELKYIKTFESFMNEENKPLFKLKL